jgi:hypothetical protein
MMAIRQLQATWPRALLALVMAVCLVTATPAASASLHIPSAPSARSVAAAAGAAGTGVLLHGTLAYDSGWTAIAQDSTHTFEHNLGGDTDDYVVDLQFRRAVPVGGGGRVSQRQYGLDRISSRLYGAYWKELSNTNLKVVRGTWDANADWVRTRIWRVPTADYDSGWQSVGPDEDKTFTHGLGGDSNDYVVDMQFKSASAALGVHQLQYGGDHHHDGFRVREEGAFWHSLGTSSISVHRGDDDAHVQQVRVRIWRRPHADYVSDWSEVPVRTSRAFHLGLPGPWIDYMVDVQFRDTGDDGYGVNHRGYGFDEYYDSGGAHRWGGATWGDLAGHGVSVIRGTDSVAADESRVRIWALRAPKYDSGWAVIDPRPLRTFEHNLGGNPDTYVVDLQLEDVDDGIGINQRGYGADIDYDAGTGGNRLVGATWYTLNPISVTLHRFDHDQWADRVRVRLWIAPEPAYDSGWETIGQDEAITLSYSYGWYPGDRVVDLQFKQDTTGFVSHGSYGGDTTYVHTNTFKAYGAYWRALDSDSDSIVVYRMRDDIFADQVRVRIWPNVGFDYDSWWTDISAGMAQQFSFSLGACARDPVVDLQFRDVDDPTFGVHQHYYGGNLLRALGQLEYGAWWQNLTSSSVAVHRGEHDVNADWARVRIWSTRGCSVYVPVAMRGAS